MKYVGTGKNDRIPKGQIVDISPGNTSQQSLIADGSVELVRIVKSDAELANAAVRGDFFSGTPSDPHEVLAASAAGLIDDEGNATDKAYDLSHEDQQPDPSSLTKVEAAKANAAAQEAVEQAQQPEAAAKADAKAAKSK